MIDDALTILNLLNQFSWPAAFLVVGLALAAAWGVPRTIKALKDAFLGD